MLRFVILSEAMEANLSSLKITRAILGLLLIFTGVFALVGGAVYATRLAMLTSLAANPVYLSAARPKTLEKLAVKALLVAQADLDEKRAAAQTDLKNKNNLVQTNQDALKEAAHGLKPEAAAAEITATPFPSLQATATPAATQTVQFNEIAAPTVDLTAEFPEPLPTATPTPLPTTAAPPPVAAAPASAIARLEIPRLKIKRAVMDIGVVTGDDGNPQWDTDRLFATGSRRDLVGHLEGSALPGEASNIVLVGHNYDYNGSGVFVNLQKLKAGDEIIVSTEDGNEIVYQVVKVKSVPFNGGDEIERHLRFLDPTPSEQLTLVTCGGANIGFFNKRVYVVAERVN